jgi:predicted transposase YdaD
LKSVEGSHLPWVRIPPSPFNQKIPAQKDLSTAVEAMLGITLEETRFYQDVKEEGRTEGRTEERAEILARTVPMLLEAGFTVEQIAERLGVELEVVRRVAEPNG